MGIQCGMVGLPNVGKSTLFNALTAGGIAAENYPFCTIDPNVGVVEVPDPRVAQLAAIVRPAKNIPTTIEFVDIAGLVSGASKGEGLGNQFLGHIRETDAIVHVVRCFEEADVVHVAGKVEPIADIDVIDTELALADLETVTRQLERSRKASKSGDKAALARSRLLEQARDWLDQSKPLRAGRWNEDQRRALRELHLITLKPALFVANVDEQGFEDNPMLERVRERAGAEGAQVVAVCAAIESEIARLEDAEKIEFLNDLGLQEPGLNRVIRAAYELLDLQTYFTAGPKEVRAWTVRRGATAPQAAGVIHTDFEKGFIRAEVVGFDDFITYSGESGAKEAGKWRLEGKQYSVNEGDVMHFRFNV